jgi:hypothetical protein
MVHGFVLISLLLHILLNLIVLMHCDDVENEVSSTWTYSTCILDDMASVHFLTYGTARGIYIAIFNGTDMVLT